MEPEDLLREWLLWHQTVEYIKDDLARVESLPTLRLPFVAGAIVRKIGSRVYAKEQDAVKKLRDNRIWIKKVKTDKGDVLVAWSYRGSTDIFRIREYDLRQQVQKRIVSYRH
ncbi:hypothetical protein ACAF76_006175 [Brevibacillus sp. TJ4]|uniref:hypothetical protein n=1 Tax=Brevibacillus sp. TJ4 TaxID=3234853 RepID=UPI0037D3BCFF